VIAGGSSPADDVLFIKVKKPDGAISPAYTVNMLVMIYTPMTNPTDVADSVYWEWGEEYDIYELDGVNYHRGMTQDQTSIQPAIYVWAEGDVYFHQRTMYDSSLPAATTTDTVSLMDANWSDFFESAVNDNGRGLTIERDARETYFPATIRFSREYQQNTSINQTNRFFFNNFIDLDRSFGSILKMSVKDRYIRIGQQFKIGSVPIFNQISKDSAGNTLLAATDVLLNPVNYYLGDFGVGNNPEAWVDFNNSSYFFYTFRGIWCRLSLDGITPISQLYKINSWASEHGVLRTGNYKIYGVYDSKANNCIFAFEQTVDDAAYTLSFNEPSNTYESFLSYHPEMMVTLGALLITYKGGDSWTHDSDKYNNFYGVQYPSSIMPVFSQDPYIKKKYLSLGYQSNKVWSSPNKGDVLTSTVNPQTNLRQESKILESNYELQETALVAALNYDMNSRADERVGFAEGDFLGGNYCAVKFICPSTSADEQVKFNMPYINFITSPRNF